MARVQNPLIGATSGSAGGMVFQRYDGKNIMRRTPFFYNYKKTAKQQNAQNTFKQYNLISISPTSDFLDILYPLSPRKVSKHIKYQNDIKLLKEKIEYEETGLKYISHLNTTKSNKKTDPFIIENNEDPSNPFIRIRYNSNEPEIRFDETHYLLLIIINVVLQKYEVNVIKFNDNGRLIKHYIHSELIQPQLYILILMQLNTHNYQSQYSYQPVCYSLAF